MRHVCHTQLEAHRAQPQPQPPNPCSLHPMCRNPKAFLEGLLERYVLDVQRATPSAGTLGSPSKPTLLGNPATSTALAATTTAAAKPAAAGADEQQGGSSGGPDLPLLLSAAAVALLQAQPALAEHAVSLGCVCGWGGGTCNESSRSFQPVSLLQGIRLSAASWHFLEPTPTPHPTPTHPSCTHTTGMWKSCCACWRHGCRCCPRVALPRSSWMALRCCRVSCLSSHSHSEQAGNVRTVKIWNGRLSCNRSPLSCTSC